MLKSLKDIKSTVNDVKGLKKESDYLPGDLDSYNSLISPELTDASDVGLFASLQRNASNSLESNTEMEYDKQLDLSAVRTMIA